MSPIPVSGLSEAEAWEATGGILGPGKHLVTVTKTDDTETSSGGYPQFILDMAADSGLGIRDWVVVIPSTYGKVRQILEAAGVPIPQGDAQLDVGPLRGKRLLITVAEQPNNRGETKTRVVAYEPATQASPSAVPTGGVDYGNLPGMERKPASAVGNAMPF